MTTTMASGNYSFEVPTVPGTRIATRRRFDQFVRANGATLHSQALRLCGNSADANDLVQDTFERALRSFQHLPAGANVRAWATTILHNRFIDGCRARRREPTHELDEECAPAAEPEPPAPAWRDITPEQLESALAQLGEEFRVVYQLHAAGNRTYKDIATELRLPPATVGTRLNRARRKLKKLLAGLLTH